MTTFDLPFFVAVGGVILLLLWAHFGPDDLGGGGVFAPASVLPPFKGAMQVFISIVVLFAALYVVIFQPDADESQKNWAFGALGTLLGFWLKPS